MSLENFVKVLKEGKEVSPLGKLQLACTLVQDVLALDIFSNESERELIEIQYKLWRLANCGELEIEKC